MRNLTLLLLLGGPIWLGAQTYTTMADAKFQQLNKNYVTTDILYDRVFPMAQLTQFNQSTVDTSQVHHFYNAYAELQAADYNNRWSTINVLQNDVAALWQQHKMAIGIINVDFESIDEDAIQDNLLAITGTDSLLVDVANRPRSPYLKKNALVISPLQENTDSKTVTFTTGSTLRMQAADLNISSLQADFRNGQGWQTLTINTSKTITFTNTGIHNIKFKATFSNGSTRYTYARLRVNDQPYVASKTTLTNKAGNNTCSQGVLEASRKFQGYDESISYAGWGEYLVYQGGSAYDRPVIVVGGFDPFEGKDNGLKVSDIYNKLLKYGSGNLNLGNDLRSSNFDIVPLNFLKYTADDGKIINGGTDYIERNAMVLVELLEQVNNCKTGNYPIKVIGFSMGGLVARYALRYMEQNGIAHNTDLFVSVDSPHKGAIVPMGIQEMADLIDDTTPFGLGNKADDLLLTPGAKQMLRQHYLAGSKTVKGAPGFYDRFHNTLNSMGFPQQTRNIAVADGTSTGQPINNPGQNYADGEIATGLQFGPIGGRGKAVLNYAPDRGQTKDVMNFKFQLKLAFLRLTLYKRVKQSTTSSATGSYENAPGGYFYVEDLVSSFIPGDDLDFNPINNEFLDEFLGEIKATLTNPNFSFVPVKSALAYSGSNDDLYEDFSQRNLVCSGETPFDTYYTSSNDVHVRLNSDSADFIEQEILGNHRPPNVSINMPNSLSGPSKFCPSATFSISGINPGPNITWSATPSSALNFTQGSTSTTATRNGSYSGSATIKATLDFGCGDTRIVTKSVIVGGTISMNWSGTGPYGQVDVYVYGGTAPYKFYRNGSLIYTSYSASTTIPFGCNGGVLKVEANTSCGLASVSDIVPQGCAPPPYYMTVHPNPATSDIYVTEVEETGSKTNSAERSDPFKIEGEVSLGLYDFNGNMVRDAQFNGNATEKKISVSGLRKGTYFLRILGKELDETHQVIVK